MRSAGRDEGHKLAIAGLQRDWPIRRHPNVVDVHCRLPAHEMPDFRVGNRRTRRCHLKPGNRGNRGNCMATTRHNSQYPAPENEFFRRPDLYRLAEFRLWTRSTAINTGAYT